MRKLPTFSYLHATSGPKSILQTSRNVTDFLRENDKIASLLPAATRMIALQKQCMVELPQMFNTCEVVQFEAGQLVLSTPNTALATKLKQQIPSLQKQLLHKNWQVNAIRIKVQVKKNLNNLTPTKQLHLSQKALSAFTALTKNLEQTPRNDALKIAIATMIERHTIT